MHGRRRTEVERRKRGHGWYQSSVCITSFSFLILPTPQSGTGFLNLLLSAQIVSRILDTSLSEPLIHRCYIWRAGQLAISPFLILHTWSVSGHLLRRAQGDAWPLRDTLCPRPLDDHQLVPLVLPPFTAAWSPWAVGANISLWVLLFFPSLTL